MKMDQLSILRRQIRILQGCVLSLTAFLVVAATTGHGDVIRTRGVVIVDENGKERIVLGSPTPPTPGRADQLATSSMIFRSAEGKDRLVLGEEPNPTVNGKIAKRIAPGWGLLWFNSDGEERGGVSYLDNGRSVVSLDRPNGEGVYLTVNERSGFAGLVANYQTSRPGDYAEALRIGTLGEKVFAQATNRGGDPSAAIVAGAGGRPMVTDVVQR